MPRRIADRYTYRGRSSQVHEHVGRLLKVWFKETFLDREWPVPPRPADGETLEQRVGAAFAVLSSSSSMISPHPTASPIALRYNSVPVVQQLLMRPCKRAARRDFRPFATLCTPRELAAKIDETSCTIGGCSHSVKTFCYKSTMHDL